MELICVLGLNLIETTDTPPGQEMQQDFLRVYYEVVTHVLSQLCFIFSPPKKDVR